ncbi:MAG: ribosomal RNA small subunit methyltransferase A [Ardenticatenales bacterium]|nr:ribosomal RNA small subunit methyltransferase A [Ardenticatenales bacterium]
MKVADMKALMAQYGLRPNKGLGQNFLADSVHLQRIVAAAELQKEELVLEVGPGLGPLTEHLLVQGAHVVAVELDKGFIRVLQDRFGTHPSFSLYHQDILASDVPALLSGVAAAEPLRYKCVANIPYYITSAVMRHLLESKVQPDLIVLLVQKEVAQRITARPGDLSLLAISVQFYGEPEMVAIVPAGAFYPPPKVDSAILRVRPYPEKRYHVESPEFFWEVVRAGFGQKRKQLKNSLSAGLSQFSTDKIQASLEEAAIDPTRRPQTLTIEEWVRLYKSLTNRTIF